MHEILLSRSPKLDRISLIAYAAELGLDVDKFTTSIDTGKYAEEIDNEVRFAQAMDIYNTPTFYINGRQVFGDRPFEDLSRIIDEELAQVGR